MRLSDKFSGETAKKALGKFLSTNPSSEIIEIAPKGKGSRGYLAISKPWGDHTLQIVIPEDARERRALIQTLNGIILPARFSAILHRETGQLEVIWTAFKLKESAEEVRERSFIFCFEGRDRECRYGPSSKDLVRLAKHCFPISIPTSTDHRNIVSLHFFSNDIDAGNIDEPISFFVDCAGLDEAGLPPLIMHLNAYMSYFDHKSPRVLVHEGSPGADHMPRSRYLAGRFPSRIDGRQLDQNLLVYWLEMVATRNEIMRFLLCYRIIEYAAFNYVESSTRLRIRKILGSPIAVTDIDRSVDLISELLMTGKGAEEIPRAQNLISAAVDLSLVWAEIDGNRGFFCEDTCFDGGYKVKSLITAKCSYESWANNGVRITLDRLRGIRNALSHGQDTQTRATILPTAGNAGQIRPWLNLIEIIAGETIIYREVV